MADSRGELIGAGASAEVFAYGDRAVLKLFRPEYGFAAEVEAERTRAVHAAGVPSPAVLDVVVVDGRRGIVLERVRGTTLLDDLVHGRSDGRAVGARTAEVQVSVHGVVAELPRLGDVVDLGGLPDGDVVGHLDLHPGNVMGSPAGAVVIDWINAHLVAAAADVARSVMAIRYEGLGLLGARGGLAQERTVRDQVLHGYLDRLDELGGRPAGLDAWLGRCAARLLRAEPANPDRRLLEALVDPAS